MALLFGYYTVDLILRIKVIWFCELKTITISHPEGISNKLKQFRIKRKFHWESDLFSRAPVQEHLCVMAHNHVSFICQLRNRMLADLLFLVLFHYSMPKQYLEPYCPNSMHYETWWKFRKTFSSDSSPALTWTSLRLVFTIPCKRIIVVNIVSCSPWKATSIFRAKFFDLRSWWSSKNLRTLTREMAMAFGRNALLQVGVLWRAPAKFCLTNSR